MAVFKGFKLENSYCCFVKIGPFKELCRL